MSDLSFKLTMTQSEINQMIQTTTQITQSPIKITFTRDDRIVSNKFKIYYVKFLKNDRKIASMFYWDEENKDQFTTYDVEQLNHVNTIFQEAIKSMV